MNKPAPKEPSMDEILSSIRQIIADDDAAAAPEKAGASPAAAAASTPAPSAPPRPFPSSSSFAPATGRPAQPEPQAAPEAPRQPTEAAEPLALSPEQIVGTGDRDDASDKDQNEADAPNPLDFSALIEEEGGNTDPGAGPAIEPTLIDPEDIAFEPDPEPETEPEPQPDPVATYAPPPRSAPEPPASPRMPATPVPPESACPKVAETAPMPDPALSSDMAEQLLQPATQAAVKHTLSRLNGLSMVGSNVTLEDMMRDLLRPMLKEWLDENLPGVVERMVEKEIARISRGE